MSMLSMAAAVVNMLAAATPAADISPLPPPPPEIGALKLPEGRLHGVSVGETSATFLDPDQVVRRGDQVDTRILTIYEPGLASRGQVVVQVLSSTTFDCAARTFTDNGQMAYDQDGTLVIWLRPHPAAPLAPGDAKDFVAKVVCDGAQVPASNVAATRAQALAAAQALIRSRRTPAG